MSVIGTVLMALSTRIDSLERALVSESLFFDFIRCLSSSVSSDTDYSTIWMVLVSSSNLLFMYFFIL